MKYDHIVKFNGKYYPAGEDVPDNNAPATGEGEKPSSVVLEPKTALTAESQKRYSKTDINKMTTSELQTLAAAEGVDGALDKTGGELKKELIDYFGL